MKRKTQAEIVQSELATNEIPINWCHIKAIMDTGCGYIVLYCVQCYCILTFLFFWICLAFECIFSSEFRPTLFFVLGMDNWTEMLLFYIQKSNVHLKPISFIVFIDMCFFFGYFQCIFFSTFSGHECVPLQGQKKPKTLMIHIHINICWSCVLFARLLEPILLWHCFSPNAFGYLQPRSISLSLYIFWMNNVFLFQTDINFDWIRHSRSNDDSNNDISL